MHNLRDKLLKAGKVSKKQKRQSDQKSRKRRASTKGHVQTKQAEAAREAAYAQQLAEAQARDKILEDERRAERALHERRLRARHIIDYYAVPLRSGRRRWHFVASNNVIKYIEVRDSDAYLLANGNLAIVERLHEHHEEDRDQYCVVPRDTARILWDMDDAYIRFLNRADPDRPERWFEVSKDAEAAATEKINADPPPKLDQAP